MLKPIVLETFVSDRRVAYNNGLTDKTAILYEGSTYMLKPASLDANGMYQSTAVSEFLGSHIYELLGIPAHETLLADYRGRPSVLCKDFLLADGSKDLELFEFRAVASEFSIKNHISSAHPGQREPLTSVLQVLSGSDFLEPVRAGAISRFWQMFVVDSFIENYDRHTGNWGYIYDKGTGEVSLAPVYDCAGSFNPQHGDADLSLLLTKDPKDILYRMDFGYETAAFSGDSPNVKLTLEHVLANIENKGAAEAVVELVPKISDSLSDIFDLVGSIGTLSDTRKEYILTTLQYRFDNILVPAYHMAAERGAANVCREDDTPTLSSLAAGAQLASKGLRPAAGQPANEHGHPSNPAR